MAGNRLQLRQHETEEPPDVIPGAASLTVDEGSPGDGVSRGRNSSAFLLELPATGQATDLGV